MERMCGMLIPLVKSQKHPYISLWNNIILNERFNHLKLNEDYKQVFPEKEKKKHILLIGFSVLLYMRNMNFTLHLKNINCQMQN